MADRDSKRRPDQTGETDRFARLDRLVRSLVDRYERLLAETELLRGELGEREQRIRALDEKLLALNQGRQDAAKRLDDLVSRLDQLDAELEARLDASGGGAD